MNSAEESDEQSGSWLWESVHWDRWCRGDFGGGSAVGQFSYCDAVLFKKDGVIHGLQGFYEYQA
jgi:hypothetical protein